jgi:hypothetical protein
MRLTGLVIIIISLLLLSRAQRGEGADTGLPTLAVVSCPLLPAFIQVESVPAKAITCLFSSLPVLKCLPPWRLLGLTTYPQGKSLPQRDQAQLPVDLGIE